MTNTRQRYIKRLTGPQMTVLSMLFHTDGQLWLVGNDLRSAARLREAGYIECMEKRWHRITNAGISAFLKQLSGENTPEGATARRSLARMESEGAT